MKNKIKSIFKILVVTAGCLMFASFSPSLDGRAVVVDEGVFPQGLFAKTVGYLPGDIISVTNIAGDQTIDLLVIGALDPSEGVAIMLSPEAADAMGIDRGANNIVKITKRSGQDERVYGNAVISKSAAEIEDWNDDEYDSIGAEENSDAFEDSEESEASPDEADFEESEDETDFEEETSAAVESEETEDFDAEDTEAEEFEEPAIEEEEEAFDEAEEEAFENENPEEEFSDESEENPEEALDEEALPEEEFADEEEAFEEEAVAEEELPEEEAPAEEAAEEETEEEFEEPEESEEEPAEEEAFDSEELDELPEEAAEEALEEEAPAEESEEEETEEDIPEEETVDEEAFEEEEPDQLPAEEEAAAEEETEEAPAEEAFDEDELDALPEETETPAEESVEETESEEYEAIVLVPADSNPPENDNDEVEDVVSEDELESIDETITLTPLESSINKSVSSVTPVSPAETKPAAVAEAETSYDKYLVPSLNQLESGKYYIQIAAYGSDANIIEIINKYGSNYPITIVPMANGKTKQVLVGPVTMDEYKVVLERFKSYGFKDAFLRKVK